MKEEYIRRVGRLLALPGKQKREVLRDLEEIFASGAEHGETEQGVIQRLGTPEEYVAGVELSLGKPRPGGKLAGLVLSCVACVVCFGLFWAAQRPWVPQEAIGFAQGSTSIQVEGAVDLSPVLLVLGVAALALAVCLAPMAAFATGDGTPAATPKNVYLDTVSGDDEKDGTQGSPVKTLARALALAEDGDTVLVNADEGYVEILD